MNVTILGNGPSRDKWDGVGDVVIGCHGGESVDYLCTNHPDRGWQPIPTIQSITRRPEMNPETPVAKANFSWGENGSVKRIQVHGLLVALPKGRWWDTGTVAVIWALYTYPKAQIHLWGFDSLWSTVYEHALESENPERNWVTSSGQKQWMWNHPRIKVCGEPTSNK